MNDKQFLLWIFDRLHAIHHEFPNSDYMARLRNIAEAMPEESVTQTEPQDTEVTRIKKTLETLIAWSVRDLGEAGVKQLLDMLNPPTEPKP